METLGGGKRVRDVGPLLVVVGIVLTVIGLLMWSGALAWFGRMPGDIRIIGKHIHVYIPITPIIIVSVVLTVLLSLFRR
jgi:hypothetical protein